MHLISGLSDWILSVGSRVSSPLSSPLPASPAKPEEEKASVSPAFFQGKVPCYVSGHTLGRVENVTLVCCYSPRGSVLCTLYSIVEEVGVARTVEEKILFVKQSGGLQK